MSKRSVSNLAGGSSDIIIFFQFPTHVKPVLKVNYIATYTYNVSTIGTSRYLHIILALCLI